MTNPINPIKEFRGRKAMTQKELAGKLGIAVQTVKSWEQDLNLPSAMIRRRLTAVLNVSSDELYLALKENRPFVENPSE